jgi:adenylosuccinate lyase
MAVWADQGESLLGRLEKDPEVSSVLSPSQLKDIFSIEPYLKNIDSIYRRLGL